ncbi:hypothetical protein [Mycolicibacterium mengxianglii]|uniref:hypothetical protein n=1 Tax=Mycolicibacterium mengxianglii TaxID=2736649 RepID=UPI0018D1F465|nr:hypothetical protein [Mycolicibacterium mengxianglii]
MANTTPHYPPSQDRLTVGDAPIANDNLLFGDPGLALFGGSGSVSAIPQRFATYDDPLYHGRHRAAD